jgi:hypothetical protein
MGILASHNIEVTVSLGLQILSADHSSDLCIVVDLFKLLAAGILLILLVDQVKGGSCVILFASVELFNLSMHTLVLILVTSCQLLEFVHLTFKSFLAQVSEFVLLFIKLLSADSLVGHCKVFVKPLTF